MTGNLPRWTGPAAALAVLVAAAGLLLSTGLLDSGHTREPSGGPADPPYLTVFMVDGLSRSVFRQELRRGNLPHVARLIRQGTYVERGVVSFPSMTGYAFYPFLTGVDAVASGVLGLRWFDRDRREDPFRDYVGRTNVEMNRDLAAEPPLLFERYPEIHTLTVNSYLNRGATRSVKTSFAYTAAKYEGKWWGADLLHVLPFEETLSPGWSDVERRVVRTAVEDLSRRPKVQWITFASPDTYSHVHGVDSTYVRLVRLVDRMVGLYRREARARGTDDDRIYAFVSDHGVENVTDNVDLARVLEEAGIRAWRGQSTEIVPNLTAPSLEDFADDDAVVAINGNLMNHVYLRDPSADGASGWTGRPEPGDLRAYRTDRMDRPRDLVALLLDVDGVEHVVVRRPDGGTAVHGEAGTGFITASDSGFAYRVRGRDPLGYGEHPRAARLLDGRFHGARAWLRATRDTRFPYAVVRLSRLMSREDAGDLVVTSAPGFDLARDYELFVGNYRGGHGGMRVAQMQVPMILAGPGIPAGARVETAAAEDVGATLLELLGIPPPRSPMAGRLLAPVAGGEAEKGAGTAAAGGSAAPDG